MKAVRPSLGEGEQPRSRRLRLSRSIRKRELSRLSLWFRGLISCDAALDPFLLCRLRRRTWTRLFVAAVLFLANTVFFSHLGLHKSIVPLSRGTVQHAVELPCANLACKVRAVRLTDMQSEDNRQKSCHAPARAAGWRRRSPSRSALASWTVGNFRRTEPDSADYLWVLLLGAAHQVTRALALCACVVRPGVLGLGPALAIRLSGEAIQSLTFTGPVVAEPTKAWLLESHGLTLKEGFAATITGP